MKPLLLFYKLTLSSGEAYCKQSQGVLKFRPNVSVNKDSLSEWTVLK